MTACTILPVDPSDRRVRTLLDYLQATALPDDDFADTSKGLWWVASHGGRPVAFAGLHDGRSEENVGYLCRAGVIPEFRGRGLQRLLIQARVRKARLQGRTAVVTDTVPWNIPSNNNLISSGFRMFNPTHPWCGAGACYWTKPLTPRNGSK